MILTFLKGAGVGGGLIIAIGAQNAFVLSQGVKKNHYILIPLICASCDALLIIIGVSGMGTLIASTPSLSSVAGLGGAFFLLVYGARAFYSAFNGGSLKISRQNKSSLKHTILLTLAVTLLNPHVYLDTILLLGTISSQYPSPGNIVFGAGAVTASFIWFFTLSIGGKMLAPLFTKDLAWKILDTFVGVVMWSIAATLLKGNLFS